jgi:hypothetical protein
MTTVTRDGAGVVSHVGSRLPAWMGRSDRVTEAFSDALAWVRERRSDHDPGRVSTDLVVLLADGNRSISDLAVLWDQPTLFGPVACTATAWRVLNKIDPAMLDRLRAARALAREQLWAQRSETTGPIGGHDGGGRTRQGPADHVRRHPGHRPPRQGARRSDARGRVRLPPAARVAGQRRSPRRGAAAG